MRTLDNHERAQRIYMSHVNSKIGNEIKKPGKREGSKTNVIMQAHDNGIKSRIQVTEAVRLSPSPSNREESIL